MKTTNKTTFITKERLADLANAEPCLQTAAAYQDCAEKMRVALATPDQLPNMITFIELV